MHVYGLQHNIVWQDPKENRLQLENKLATISPKAKSLLLFPEMFTTGFSMNAKSHSEPHLGPTVEWMKTMSAKHQCFCAGSVMTNDNGSFYNRLYVVAPSGEIDYYDKHQLFTYSGEDKIYTPGTKQLVVNIFGVSVAFYVCYDLRFPEWCRNTPNNAYDLAVFVANWPEVRAKAWQQLLFARAIENRAYVFGVNRVGPDGNGLEYNGCTAFIDFDGKKLNESIGEDACIQGIVDLESLKAAREKFPVLKDQIKFSFDE